MRSPPSTPERTDPAARRPAESSSERDGAIDRSSPAPPTLTARTLLGPCGRVSIEHDGALYELRLTRNNKLILTK